MCGNRILCIDDCELIRGMIKDYLERENYIVSTAENGVQAFREIEKNTPDLILLDFMLDDTDGISLMRELHHQNIHIPIIMVSGRGEDIDRIIGIEAGADDYIAKPFQPRELSARIKAVLKRTRHATHKNHTPQAPDIAAKTKLKFDKWILDPAQFQVFDQNNHSAGLTTGEFVILEKLATSSGQTFTREQLFGLLNNNDMNAFDRAVDIKITRIRAKLGDTPKDPKYIKTIRGIGYVFIG